MVKHGPVFGYPNRMMQRQDDAARVQANLPGFSGESCEQDHRIRVQPAIARKVAFRYPDRGKTVGVSKFCTFDDQAIDIAIGWRRETGEKNQTELDSIAR